MVVDSESNAFSVFRDTPDESRFVHQAMYQLGFLCEFADLSTDQMRIALAMAEYLKRTQGRRVWES